MLATLLAVVILGLPLTAQTGTRRALLISNASYQRLKPLAGASSDTRALAKTLSSLSFQTQIVENLNLDGIDQAVERFASQVGAGEVALLYFTGYGVQVGGENYLTGVEFDPGKEQEIDYAAYSMRRAIGQIEGRGAALNVLLFDAAYDDGRLRARYPSAGLTLLTPGRPGTLVGFSASANQLVAPGGEGSLYARALVETFPLGGLNLPQVFAQVKRRVSDASGGMQVPAEMSTVVAEFRFNPKSEDLLAWEQIAAKATQPDLQDFITRFPASPHAAEARQRLAVFEQQRQIQANRKLAEATLADYKQAFEQRDIERLKAIWPGLSRQETSSFQDFFRIARTVTMNLDPVGNPAITADSASWICKRKVEATDERGRMPAQETEITIKMKLAGARMVIDSIAVNKK
jgi:hypothetical protein